jgi:hypothetical protein
MKSRKNLTTLLVLFLFFEGCLFAQHQKSDKTPFTTVQIVKAIDKKVKLSDAQKDLLSVKTELIVEDIKKNKVKKGEGSLPFNFQLVLDSILTDSQKELMKQSTKDRCDKETKKYKEKNNSNK